MRSEYPVKLEKGAGMTLTWVKGVFRVWVVRGRLAKKSSALVDGFADPRRIRTVRSALEQMDAADQTLRLLKRRIIRYCEGDNSF